MALVVYRFRYRFVYILLLIDLVGVESGHSAIEVKDSQMKPEPQMRVTPLPIFGAKCKWKPIKRDK